MKFYKLSLLFVLISFGLYAQTGTITGTVIDKDSGEPLIGATAVVEGTGKGAITNLDGIFKIEGVSPGSYTLKISFIGYETYEESVSINAGETKDAGEILLPVSAVGLQEVEVFASVVEDRKTPVAVSTISGEAIEERFVGVSLAQIVQNTPGVYAVQGAGGYGDEEVYIRGFDQTNIAFLINGIPVNDMENGRMYWSNFAGLNEVTRQMQVQRGLGASKLAINSIGGTVNMISSPADRKEGGKIEYQFGTGSWNERLRFTYHTGLTDNGWAVTLQGSKTTTNGGLVGKRDLDQGGIIPGAYTDAYSYYLAISKQLNEQHTFQFWGFGAPVDRGTSWVVDDRTRDLFGFGDEPRLNNALGIYNGELLNVRQNKSHKPMMALTHYFDMDKETTITTSVYYSFANVYSTQPVDTESSLFFSDRSQNIGAEITPGNLINWDYLADQNRRPERFIDEILHPNNNPLAAPVSGYASQYYLEARYNNHNWIGLISNYRKQLDKLSILGGVDLRHYKGSHFAKVHELFGGDFVLNQSRFGDAYNYLESNDAIIAPGDNTNDIAYEGDLVNYNYDGTVNWAAAFIQGEYTLDHLDIFATATGTYSSFYRVGKFWNTRDRYFYNSLGKSETKDFLTYTLKAGVNYRPDNRHNIFANAGVFTRPPFLSSAFADSRYSNQYREGLQPEEVYSAELGYGYRTSKIKANINAYYTIWNNRVTEFDLSASNFTESGIPNDFFLPVNLQGLQSLHKGLELDVTWNVISSLELMGYVSLGDWEWNKNPEMTVTIDEVESDALKIPLKGLPVGSTAQRTAGVSFHYTGLKSTYFGGRYNYADQISVRYAPEDVEQGYITKEVINSEFDDYGVLDLYAGRYFDLSDNISGRLSVSVQNVTNTNYVRWASYFDNQFQKGYGYPRTYTIGLQITF